MPDGRPALIKPKIPTPVKEGEGIPKRMIDPLLTQEKHWSLLKRRISLILYRLTMDEPLHQARLLAREAIVSYPVGRTLLNDAPKRSLIRVFRSIPQTLFYI
jgi:hypothetical protein